MRILTPALVFAIATPVLAETIVFDTFTDADGVDGIGGAANPADERLEGHAPDIYTGPGTGWVSGVGGPSGSYPFISDSDTLINGGASGSNARLYAGIDIGAIPADATATVSMDLNLTAGAFIAFGFSDVGNLNVFENGSGPWAFINPAGNATVFGGPSSTNQLPALNGVFDGSAPVVLSFTNSATPTLSLTVDGVAVLTDAAFSHTGTLDPDHAFVYFRDVPITGGSIDNFLVDVTSPAIPEPMSVGLLGVSALALLRRRRA